MKWLRSSGLFTLFLVLGLFMGTRVGYSFSNNHTSHWKNPPVPILATEENFVKPLPDDQRQEENLPTTLPIRKQTNYLVLLVSHLKEDPENPPLKVKSAWLVISQPGVPTVDWIPLEPFDHPIPSLRHEKLANYLNEAAEQQGVLWDHYLIMDQPGLRLSLYLLNQVINHLERQSDNNTLTQLGERLAAQSSDLRQQAKWIAQLCELAPPALAHVDVNRFLNLLQLNYRTDLDRAHLKSALYELKLGADSALNCVFPTLVDEIAVP